MTSSNSAETQAEVDALTEEAVASRYYDWLEWARPDQLPLSGDWTTWLMLGGRGAGKTRAGAEWVRALAAQQVSPIALVGETMTEAIAVMIRGESGLLNVHPDEDRPVLRGTSLRWPNGVEAFVMSASDPDRFRGPQFAAAWCDELGCGAVDKGANQPNIFGDEKSAESGRPHFSSGMADPLIQRQFLRAHQRFWREPANNPAGMVDVSRIYCWTWDSRPFPAFPAQDDVWADGPNYRTGHWLTGRLGAMASDEMAAAVAAEHGVTLLGEPALPLVQGLVLDETTTGRDALEPLIAASGLSLRAGADGLKLGQARRVAAIVIDPENLVQEDGPVLSRRRGDPAEAPGRLALTFVDRERDYQLGTVTALRGAGPVASKALPLVLDLGGARIAAERGLLAESGGRESLEFSLPPSALALEPGDVVDLGIAEGPFEVTEIRDGAVRQVTARTLAAPVPINVAVDATRTGGTNNLTQSRPVVLAAHLPPLPEDAGRTRLALAAHAQPWPGAIGIADSNGANLTRLARRAVMGETLSDLTAGPTGIWDRGGGTDAQALCGASGGAGRSGSAGGRQSHCGANR